MNAVRTWTDDHGVTHDMSGYMAMCRCDVSSKAGPCKDDAPTRVVTCMFCLSDVLAPSAIRSFVEKVAKHGVYVDPSVIGKLHIEPV